jgi:hypothetical protein
MFADVMRSKILVALGVIAAIAAIGGAIGWFAGRGAKVSPPIVQSPPPEVAINPQPSPVVEPLPPPPPPPVHTVPVPAQVTPKVVVPPVIATVVPQVPTNSVAGTNWDEKIDDIIGSDDADTNKVKQLFALFPQLPPDEQEDAVSHLSNLVEDNNYAPLGEMLKNPKLSEGVQDELMSDVLNRPNNVKLPLLLDVARNPDHAKRDEAKDLLELYLGEDYGTDWKTWQDKMTAWLKENPE